MTPQPLQALAYANEIRFGQAAIRREIAALPRIDGMQRAAELLADPCPTVERMRLRYLLGSINRYAAVRVSRCLRRSGVATAAQERRIADLTERQRASIIAELRS